MTISIIIPVYNASLYLKECLDSIVNQDFKEEFEVVLVNDGSTDESLNICYEFASRFSNIIVLTGENAGVSVARNKALDIARGEWLVFVDADDKLLPGALSILYERQLQTGADMVLANAVKLTKEYSKPFLKLPNETLPNAICNIKHFALWSYLIPSEIVRKHNLRFVEGLAYSEDRIFIYQLAGYCKTIAYTDLPVYVYRINPSSVCQSKDGVRKAKHHFLAAYHLYNIASIYSEIDGTIFKHLKREAKHVVNLGIYMFLQQHFNIRMFNEVRMEYLRLLGTGLAQTMMFYKFVITDYCTIQRRKFITFKKQK